MTEDADERSDANLLAALTTEQFVLQSTRATVTGEAGARASLYVGALSSALVALAFAGQFEDAFTPFAAAVLPAILVLGVFTYVRLAEIGVEDLRGRCRDHHRRRRGVRGHGGPHAGRRASLPADARRRSRLRRRPRKLGG